jgi:hypothetical protein
LDDGTDGADFDLGGDLSLTDDELDKLVSDTPFDEDGGDQDADEDTGGEPPPEG